MSGNEEQSGGEDEEELVLSTKTDEIVDKKGHATSVIWKWFGYLKGDDAQTKAVCKICRRFVPTGTENMTNLFHRFHRFQTAASPTTSVA